MRITCILGVVLLAATATADAQDAYFEFQVEKPAIARGHNPAPRYPEELRSGGVAGRVLVQFVVGENGTPEMGTFRVIRSDHYLFTEAVRTTLPRMRFYPAEVGERRVRMWVQQEFVFRLTN